MVWERRSQSIVMVTNCIERGTVSMATLYIAETCYMMWWYLHLTSFKHFNATLLLVSFNCMNVNLASVIPLSLKKCIFLCPLNPKNKYFNPLFFFHHLFSIQIKCEQYWPLDYTPCLYGNLLVTVTSEDKAQSWTLRVFTVNNVSTDILLQQSSFT